jgi:hypothetical protein
MTAALVVLGVLWVIGTGVFLVMIAIDQSRPTDEQYLSWADRRAVRAAKAAGSALPTVNAERIKPSRATGQAA